MALRTVHYVSGDPDVEYGTNGGVLVHWPVAEGDEIVTLAFKSDEHYQLAAETQALGYGQAREARSRRLYPSLPWGAAS
jgi:hypothetical protein